LKTYETRWKTYLLKRGMTMKEENFESALAEIIKNYTDSTVEAIHRTTFLREELGLSSFDMIALSTEIEDTFSIHIDNLDIFADIETFGDLVELITEHH
jgi:acyl carrier protein